MNLPKNQSAFLWGARKTGKSTYLKQHFPNLIYYDFLKSDEYLRYLKAPHKLREELLAIGDSPYHIIIDEVQKVPQILDEIQWLIENANLLLYCVALVPRNLKEQVQIY
ncbi:MAG: AAA family ATPase [Candidatus Midichloria sp.]|nr:AAA family ATPase [Candidatus Midichloria sp.]